MEGNKHNVGTLWDEPYRQLCACRVKEVMSDNNRDLWGTFKRGVLKACNDVCGYEKNWTCNVDMWWWNSGAKDGIQKKQEADKEMTRNPTNETQNEYRRRLKKVAKKAVARAVKE